MNPRIQLSALLLTTAFACGGQVRPLPDGYGEGGTAGDDAGEVSGSSGGAGSSGAAGSSSGGSPTGSSSGGSTTPTGGGATCGGVLCGGTEVCCVSAGTARDAGAGSEACSSAAACKGLSLACGDASQCSDGDVCCVTFNLASALGGGAISGSSSCKKTCPTGTGEGQLCSTDTECPQGVTCQSTEMGGSVCGGIMSLLGGL
jgi:hypothetical protein